MKTTRGENGTNKWCKINLRQPDYCALCSQYARGKRHEGKKKIANCNLNFCRSATLMSRTCPVTTTVEDRTTRPPPPKLSPIVANRWACSSPGSTTPGLLLHQGSLSTINRHGWFWMPGENGVDTRISKQPPWEYRRGTNNTTLNNTLCMLSKPTEGDQDLQCASSSSHRTALRPSTCATNLQSTLYMHG